MRSENDEAIDRQSFHQGTNLGIIIGGFAALVSPGVGLCVFIVSVAYYLYRDGKGWR